MKGFTIIESVLALGIIGAGLLGLIYSISQINNGALLADQTIVAVNIARETLEQIIAQRDCAAAGCGYASTITSINTNKTYNANPVSGFAPFVLSTTALEVDPDSDGVVDDFLDAKSSSGYARVTATVSWNSGANSIKLETLITDYIKSGGGGGTPGANEDTVVQCIPR